MYFTVHLVYWRIQVRKSLSELKKNTKGKLFKIQRLFVDLYNHIKFTYS